MNSLRTVMFSMLTVALMIFSSATAVAGGAAEEGSGARVEYLAGQGVIVHPRDIQVSQFISAVDYGYPEPEGPLGVYAYPGQYQVSTDQQEVLLSLGVQAARRTIADLPPLNISFVVDTSGSMSAENKIDWVRDSLEVFERSVRVGDTVSLISFDSKARVLLPATRIRSAGDRRRFLSAVRSLRATGSTNLYAGLELGFAQLVTQLSSENVNRIVLLGDGMPNTGVVDPRAFRQLAQGYRDVGVSISAIGLGTEANLGLLRDIAHWSSGTSRFINDRRTMEEVFGSGLGRLIVPVARELNVEVRVAPGVRIVNTWGYDHRIVGSTVTYSIPALHDSDYETLVAVLELPHTPRPGEQRIATVETTYRGEDSRLARMDPVPVAVERVDMKDPVVGATDAMALRAATMLRYGQVIVEVGQRYYDQQSRAPEGGISPAVAESLLGLVSEFKFEMENSELRLDDPLFAGEISVLTRYQDILAQELQIAQELRSARYDQFRRLAPVPDRSVHQHIEAVTTELCLSMRNLRAGRVAVLGVAGIGEMNPQIEALLIEQTYSALSRLPGFSVATADSVSLHLQRGAVAATELADARRAAALGRALGVEYVVTGILVASPQTIHFFERVIRTSDGEVLSAAQVMLPR